MFKLENTNMLKNTLLAVGISLFLIACSSDVSDSKNETSVDGAVKYPTKDGKYSQYHVNMDKFDGSTIGRAPTKTEIAAWDTDVMYDGTGLPEFDMHEGKPVLDEDGNPKKAQGSVEEGSELYDAQCVMCHGDFGSGGKGYPKLAGGSLESLKNQRLNPADENPSPDSPDRTIGSYWPYASTLYWYIQESMPFNSPKTLTNSETYALTAYMLSINDIEIDGESLDDDFILDKEQFLKIVMPNVDGFYPETNTPENPKLGVENMTKYLSNPKNYGTGTRCMSNCLEDNIDNLKLEIKDDLTLSANEKLSTKRDLKAKVETKSSIGETLYNDYGCAACHSNKAIGAPVVGDKSIWENINKQGFDKVLYNAINGINAMPPRGGTDLSDDELKEIVSYMINSSK
ncbi:c-type cytochrome [Arcobacter porcinus]|uniref:Cytochrome c5 n=1 Tax=Arcobacter porcinus TaxID=1935204 RepID=A0ABX2YCS9_9BACT|nr:c-type cytochrome [Arcobacter porcinus]OCL83570.1 Cytochrome c5 [Arcobacter porcinus]OCL83789.1 Cytochrome c5 [Arcobacter porcinus]OCL92782.1 Cytochrome c5 [Arcobacter porcinus]